MKTSVNRKIKKVILIPVGIAALLSLVSYVVMLLWNNLLPEILHVSTINFWQAMGLFILCKIPFGFGKGNGGGPWGRHKMMERFKGLTPEERLEFKEEMKHKMCGWKKQNAENN